MTLFYRLKMPPVSKRWGRQKEQIDEVSDQIFTGHENPIPEDLDPTVRSIGGSTADNRVEQLAVEIGEIRHEMRTSIELLAD